MTTWTNNTAVTTSTLTWPLTTSASYTFATGFPAPAAEYAPEAGQSPLTWLDDEIEQTCKLARVA